MPAAGAATVLTHLHSSVMRPRQQDPLPRTGPAFSGPAASPPGLDMVMSATQDPSLQDMLAQHPHFLPILVAAGARTPAQLRTAFALPHDSLFWTELLRTDKTVALLEYSVLRQLAA